MKSSYYRELSPTKLAVLDLSQFDVSMYHQEHIDHELPFPDDGAMIFWIARVNVPKEFRGKGIARDLMLECLRDADRDQAWIYLGISPSDGLSYDQLKNWYMGLGFVKVGPLELWVRKPAQRFYVNRAAVDSNGFSCLHDRVICYSTAPSGTPLSQIGIDQLMWKCDWCDTEFKPISPTE